MKTRFRILAVPAAISLAFAGSVHAAEIVKANNNTNMNQTGSWVGGVLPGAADIAVFNDTYTQTASTGTGGPLSWQGIRVEGTNATPIVVNNTTVANWVSLGTGGIDMSAAPRDMNIASVNIATNQTWTVASGRLFRAGAVASGTGNERLTGSGNLVIAGGGTVEMKASNGSPGKLFTGNITVQSGATLRTTGSPALGTTAGTTTIQSGGTLVLATAGLNFQGELVTVGGNGVGDLGAIQCFAESQSAFSKVTLTGDTKFNAASRFDIRDPNRLGEIGLDLAGFTLTKVGAAIQYFSGCTVTAGNIVVAEGAMGFQDGVLVPASAGHTVMIAGSGNLRFWRSASGTLPCVFARDIVAADGATISWNGNDTADAIDQSVAAPILAQGLLKLDQISGNASVFELAGAISGASGSVLKTGAGTIILSGANTFGGVTTVEAGTLQLSGSLAGGVAVQAGTSLLGGGSISGAVTVAGALRMSGAVGSAGGLSVALGGSVNPGGALAAGSIATASLQLEDAELVFDTSAPGVGDDITIAANGAFTAGGVTLVDVAVAGGWQVGSYPLIKYSGTTVSPGVLPFQLITDLGHASGSLVDTGSAIALSITSAPPTKWAGNIDEHWDFSTKNWQSSDQFFLDGDAVIFDNTASGNFEVTLDTIVRPSAVTFTGPQDYGLSGLGAITGPATTLTKSGSATTVIGTINGYGGGTTITGGTLALLRNATNESPSLGTGPVTVGAGCTLRVGINGQVANAIGGAGVVLKSHPVDATFTTFSGNNTYTGATIVQNGSLSIGSPTALGDSANGTLVADAARLYIGNPIANNSVIAEPVTLQGGPDQALPDFQIGNARTGIVFSGPVALEDEVWMAVDSGSSITFSASNAITHAGAGTGADLVFDAAGSAAISGALDLGTGALVKTGAGTLTLSNGGNVFGDTEVVAGTLALTGNGVLGSGTHTVAGGALLALEGTLNTPFASALTGDGILLKSGAGNAVLAAANGLTGGTRIDAGLLLVSADHLTGAGTLHVNGGALASADGSPKQLSSPVLLGSNPAFGDIDGVFAAPVTYTGHVEFAAFTRWIRTYADTTWATSSGNGGMSRKLGNATLTLKGTHDWTAGTAATEVRQGTLALENATLNNYDAVRVMADTDGATARLVVGAGSSLAIALNSANLRLGYTPDGHPGGTNIADIRGTVVLPGGGTGGKLQVGTVSAATALNLHPGSHIVTAGFQDMNTASNDVINCDGGRITVIADSTNTAATAFLQGLDAVNLLAGGLTLDTNGNTTRVNQALQGAGGLVKQGAGTLVLGGANNYAGATTVEAGTLATVAPGTTGAGATTVLAGATLAGTGAVTGHAFVAGTVSPGLSAGALSVGGTLTLLPKARYVWESPTWSALLPGINYDTVVAGVLDITATAADPVTIVIANAPPDFSETALSFPIIQTTGGITGFSAGKFAVDASAFAGSGTWAVTQSGNNLLLVYTPGAGGDPYDAWAGPGGFNLTGGRYDDDDGDGVENVLEFLLNGDPTDPGNNGLLKPLVQDASAPAGNELTLVAAMPRGTVFAAGPGGVQSATVGTTVCTVSGGPVPGASAGTVTHAGKADTAPAATGLPPLAGTEWEYHTFSLDAAAGLAAGRGFLRVSAAPAP